MNLKRLASKILPVARVLGTALAGPAGPIVNMALTAVGAALGVEPTKPAIEAALNNDPEALVKLKTAELAFDQRMRELDVDVFEIATKDVQSARLMALQKTMWPQIVLSVVFLLGYFLVLKALFDGTIVIEENMRGIVALLLGVLTTNVPIIMAFWFGSSAGSKSKVTPGTNGTT